jgi:4'-phosphopantetheinyl transferase EntD
MGCEQVANALKASLIEDAVKRRVEHVAQQAAAQEAARLKDYMPKGFNNTLGY